MKCSNCLCDIPEATTKCPCCEISRFTFSQKKKPLEDKYGFPTSVFNPDGQKYDTREIYLHRLPEFTYCSQKKRENNARKGTYKAILFTTLAIILCFCSTSFLLNDTWHFLLIGLILIGFFGNFLIEKYCKKKIIEDMPTTPDGGSMDIHTSKECYYVSQNVIGYSVLHHSSYEDDIRRNYYVYYEFDKANIEYITYNSKFAEYELHLKMPVYTDYSKPKTNVFYIADIFDDTILSMALGCDLPPKQINF